MPHIDSYVFGMATIDGHTYTSDLKIFPDKVKPGWWREEGHKLQISDISDAIAFLPEIIIIGTGARGDMKAPAEVREHIKSLGIEFITLPTKEAIEKHNAVAESKRVVTCLHLTC